MTIADVDERPRIRKFLSRKLIKKIRKKQQQKSDLVNKEVFNLLGVIKLVISANTLHFFHLIDFDRRLKES
jgi:hypothetical protein